MDVVGLKEYRLAHANNGVDRVRPPSLEVLDDELLVIVPVLEAQQRIATDSTKTLVIVFVGHIA